MEIDYYEGRNKGHWWYSQLLIAQAKCQKNKTEYKTYCKEFIEFLEAYGPPPQREREWGKYAR